MKIRNTAGNRSPSLPDSLVPRASHVLTILVILIQLQTPEQDFTVTDLE